MLLKTKYVPVCQNDMRDNGWDSVDIVLISGDAYIDHPAFGVSLLARFLIEKDFRVGIIAQPQKDEDFLALGRPKLFFGISSGNVDSMVSHYTAQRKIRSNDDYSPNSKPGMRPDRAVLIYTQKVKQLYKDVIVVIGGVEASMRRIPHYDFMSDKIKNSILIDSKASILVYGNGESQLLEIAYRIQNKKNIDGILGTCSYSSVVPDTAVQTDFPKNNDDFFHMTKHFYENHLTKTWYYLYNNRYLIHYPPAKALSTEDLDSIYNLPFSRESHIQYKGKFIKAFEQIKYSILSHRGCYGGCSFCSIAVHQGKVIQSRSKESIMKEIGSLSKKSYFKGTISDIAGASANMYGTYCKAKISQTCQKRSCLYPEVCKDLSFNEKYYLSVLQGAYAASKVKNVFISSGVRIDLALLQPDFVRELACFYTSGSLKVAPEHINEEVLKMMHKPPIMKYLNFAGIYLDICKKIEKKQFIIPYLIVGFPGCTLENALELAIFLKKNNLCVEQIQEFTPTPMTIATMMYFTGKDYDTGKDIYVPKGREIKLQKALAQWYMKANKKLVIEALKKLNRLELISFFQ